MSALVVTTALIKRLAKLTAKEQRQIFEENINTNFQSMIEKCGEIEQSTADDTLSQQINDLKFLAGVYLHKQKRKDAVEIIV